MGWKIYDEAIDMIQRQFGYFPRVFCWQGHRYDVDAVEKCWSVSRQDWQRQIQRHYFQLRCAEGTFEVYQDVKTNTWHLRRARLGPARVTAARRTAAALR
jgi:hypothetical protein